MYRILLNSPLFKGLTIDELNSLFQQVRHQIRHFRSGEMLAQAGENRRQSNAVDGGSASG